MIAVVKRCATDEQLGGFVRWIEERGLKTHVSRGENETIVGIIGDTSRMDPFLLESMSIIDHVQRVSEPFKKANRKFHPEDTVVDCGHGVLVGGGNFQVIAGPCFVEGPDIVELARSAKAAGATILRGDAIEPRTSPYAFQGLGERGLDLLLDAARQTDMPVVSQVMDPRDVEVLVNKGVDIMQVGSRSAQNLPLLREVGKTSVPVLLKRGPSQSVDDLLMAAEYVMSEGNASVTVDSIRFSFGDQTDFKKKKHDHDFDCEAMFATEDHLYLLSKGWKTGTTRLYRLPKASGRHVAEVVNGFDSQGLITGADYDREHHVLAIVGYVKSVWKPFMYFIFDFDEAGQKLSHRRFEMPQLTGFQTEGICFFDKGKCYLSAETSPTVATRVFVIDFNKWIQKDKKKPKKAAKAYEAALTSFEGRDYSNALQQLNKALEADPYDARIRLLQGEIGMETRDYELAQAGYESLITLDPQLFPPAAITLARLYDRDKRYTEAVRLLQWFQYAAPGNKANDEAVAELLANVQFREQAIANPVDFAPQNLGPVINTPNEEYVNALELTGTELLFTRRLSAEGVRVQDEGLFIANGSEGTWYSSSQLSVDPAMDNSMGAAFLSYRGDELYFTFCGSDRHHQGCDLYKVSRDLPNASWKAPESLGEEVNDPAWDSQPCLSVDGNELFFASRRNGNADLYHCYRKADGEWSSPESLGQAINTDGNEMAPFLHPDGKTLYFSSNKHVGMGGYDLFMSRRDADGRWSAPVNLGYPINTPGDEINFIVAADGHTALISSVRDGGYGGYDIYTFQLCDEVLQPEPVNVYECLVDDLSPGTVVRLLNIQFDYDKATLTAESEEGVAMLAQFLQDHPELHVELAGHTDDKGSDAYNMELSKARAEVVMQALVTRDVDPTRLTAKGYGSSMPICPNDSEEHRARNRRTEMRIVN